MMSRLTYLEILDDLRLSSSVSVHVCMCLSPTTAGLHIDQCSQNVDSGVLVLFIHFYSAPSSPLLLRGQRRSRLQHLYCIGVSRRSAQATAGKGLAQGPYMAARAGVETTTLRLKAIASTKAPPSPIYYEVNNRDVLKQLAISVPVTPVCSVATRYCSAVQIYQKY